MKRILILTALLFTTLTVFAQNGKSIYQKYAGTEKVSANWKDSISSAARIRPSAPAWNPT